MTLWEERMQRNATNDAMGGEDAEECNQRCYGRRGCGGMQPMMLWEERMQRNANNDARMCW